jgi:NTP pyrophosphatase (non-canonical NTP hydrolase)
MNLNEASQWAFEISKKRNQYKEDGKDTIRALKHCAGEVIEAVDAYDSWHNEDYTNTKEEFENELADIIICVLSISGAEKIDIEQAISRKMLINEGRVKNECIK